MSREVRMIKAVMLVSFLSTMLFAIIGMIAVYQQVIGTMDTLKTLEILLLVNLGQLLILAIRNWVLKEWNYPMTLLNASKVIVSKGEFLNVSVKPDTDLYEKGITPINTRKECVFTAVVEVGEFQKPPLLTMSRTYKGKTTAVELNDGKGLSVEDRYMFNIIARSGELINFKFNSSGMVKKFAVEEYYVP